MDQASGPGLFGDPASRAMRFALGGLSQRLQVIGDNLANADTPGYVAQKVDFESVLQSTLAGAGPTPPPLFLTDDQPGHLAGQPVSGSSPGPAVVANLDNAPRNDGNNVNVDQEMTALAETGLTYSAMGQLMTINLSQLRSAIRGS